MTAELMILQAAKEWGIPPWQVEAECNRKWWRHWVDYQAALDIAIKHEKAKLKNG